MFASFLGGGGDAAEQGWEATMTDLSDVRCVLFLHCPEEVLEQRLLSRGKNSGRTDDNAEAAKKRFRTYVETTLPVSSQRFIVPVGLAATNTCVLLSNQLLV